MYHFEIRVWISGSVSDEYVSIIAESYDIAMSISNTLCYAVNVDDVKIYFVGTVNGSDNPYDQLVYEMSDPNNTISTKLLKYL